MNSIDKKVEVLKKVKKGIIAKIIIIKKKIKMREIMNHKVVLANIIILQMVIVVNIIRFLKNIIQEVKIEMIKFKKEENNHDPILQVQDQIIIQNQNLKKEK